MLSKIDSTNYNTQWVSQTGGGNVSNVGTPINTQLAIWTGATTIQGVTVLPAVNFPAMTGDVTNIAGSLSNSIGANKVTYAKMQAASAASRLIGSPSTGTGLGELTPGTGISISGTTINGTGGTVTNFGANNLSPLFTTSVSNSTSTPVLSFSMDSVPGYAWFGNNSGSLAVPSFFTSPMPISLMSAAGSNTQVQYNNNGVPGGITNATTDGTSLITTGAQETSPYIGGDPWGVIFVKRLTGVVETTTANNSTNIIYTVPSGRTCMLDACFRLTASATASNPTTQAVVQVKCGIVNMSPPLTLTTITNTVGNLIQMIPNSGALGTCPAGSNVTININTASSNATETGDYTALFLIY